MPGNTVIEILAGSLRFLLEIACEGILRHLIRAPGFVIMLILHLAHLHRPDPDYESHATLISGILFWLTFIGLIAALVHFLLL